LNDLKFESLKGKVLADDFGIIPFDQANEMWFSMAEPGDEIIVSEQRGKTSDKYKKEVRRFLDENKIYKTENIKRSTYRYIYDRNNIPLPGKGEQFRFRTQQQMNLITIILRVIEKHNIIDELTIATYTLNREAMSILTQLRESGKIKVINLLVASSYRFRDPKWKGEIEDLCRLHKLHLTFADSHFKITLVKAGSDYYQLEGSMNYSTNNMAEQILLENNQETYKKDYEFITKIMGDRDSKALEVIC